MLYSVYGLRLQANARIPGLRECSLQRNPDTTVCLGAIPEHLNMQRREPVQTLYVSPVYNECGRPLLTVQRVLRHRYFRLTYGDDTTFVVDRNGTHIWGAWPKALTLEDTAVYLLGPILGLALRLKGFTCLHSSAVAHHGRTLALVGPAGAGKSTTAAALVRRGYPIVSEDVLRLQVTEDGFLAQPGYAQVRLWPSAVEMLYGSRDALPRLTPNWDKRGLDLISGGYTFQSHALPLAAIYVLGRRRADTAAPSVDELSPREALMTLVTNTYVNYLLEPHTRAQEFALLTELVTRVPIRLVHPHTEPARLSQLCDVILDDFERVSAASHVQH